ncbi:replication-associated recombination protein A [Rothia sp. ZJ1223]|uniref:replication-associated recombination protein A n=1 Tax=Rothia sp. ZJ1223 TaxID=2811098 RepID=UPI00195E86F9|nr:replication-associated recombination protein A [Rothia sp. ZJ1223]MBM7050485.1 replication-associated recombination protein A [Rothia sp. ZJ1223]
MADLFDAVDDDSTESEVRRVRAPLAVRMRPRVLDEIVGQKHLLRPGSPLRVLAGEKGRATAAQSVILWGPPGIGKTTLANVIARSGGRKFVELSAITAGVKDVRAVMEQALQDRDFHGISTVLFLDEIHRFTKAQQDALLPGVENGWVVLIAATTENPSFSVISPLLSRSVLLTLTALEDDDIADLLQRAVTDRRGLYRSVSLSDSAREHLVRASMGDARRALTSLEAAAAVALEESSEHQSSEVQQEGVPEITLEHALEALNQAAVRYDRAGDQHYDVTSAFIKSIRGSDVNAALHYLARMIVAGEDPRFIARRLVVHASEDIGMADPTALTAAVSAAQAVQLVGMPEARLNLAQATVHLATAPKSNAVYRAIDAAIADVKAGGAGSVPLHLRDAHYQGADALGHGRGYIYPHDEPAAVAAQQYLPDELMGTVYYVPSRYGAEKMLAERLERVEGLLHPEE